MKTTAISFCLLLVVALASAQMHFTNNVTRAEALKAASKLKVGMSEQEVGKTLAKQGLLYFNMAQRSNECQRTYPLIKGETLGLFFAPQVVTKDGHWSGIGLLQGACVFSSNGWHGTTITLTNQP